MQNAFTIKIPDYSLRETLFCGQCFRFREPSPNLFRGVCGRHLLTLKQVGEEIHIEGCSREVFESRYYHYFAFDENYAEIKQILCRDPVLARAIDYCPGIRILNQDLFETAFCFIISQNNNIKRISRLTEQLCRSYGEDCGGFYAFPTPEALRHASETELRALGFGYRAPYLCDAARKFSDGELDIACIRQASLSEAQTELRKIHGIGPKVADCILLFGAHRLDAFPIDVWMKRAMCRFYPDGLPDFVLPYAGIAQQYLFHFARTSDCFKE